MEGRAWWQALRAAGHIASTVKKQKELNVGTQLAFSLKWSLAPQPMFLVPPTFRVGLKDMTTQLT